MEIIDRTCQHFASSMRNYLLLRLRFRGSVVEAVQPAPLPPADALNGQALIGNRQRH